MMTAYGSALRRMALVSTPLAAGLVLAGCALTQSAPRPSAEALRTACPLLASQSIPASRIGLPSGVAQVSSASLVAATPATPATPDYCKVLGSIAPIDPAAQRIQFQVNLPLAWNGKALQYGGGGYNGALVTGLAPLRDAAPDDALPLARGYLTLGTDSGHQGSTFAANAPGQFGLNDEMLVNYAYASYKKVHDVAMVLTLAFYGMPPERFYYFGGSEGGREGLTMAQRFPADYDGIVSIVPVVQLSMLFQSYMPHVRPQFSGGWLSPDKVATLARFVAQSCDGLDGLADGVVNNYLACPAHVDLQRLRCGDGADTGANCLSDSQIATVRAVHAPFTLPFPVANGLTTYPQWLYGNELTPDPAAATMTRWVTGTAAPTPAVDAATASQQWLYGANFVRYFVTRDASFEVRNYDPANYRARLEAVSALIDSSNPDLSAFFARGGKLIVRENTGDLAQSPLAGIDYFAAVSRTVGASVMEKSARLYVSPASTHTGHAASTLDGAAVATMVDLLDPLDHWVTRGQAPADAIVQTVKTAASPFTLLASRPMCRYPNYPHFQGGDPRIASSYACTPSQP
jgi:pimeloyl-ACP methyl ester carboxylesterase